MIGLTFQSGWALDRVIPAFYDLGPASVSLIAGPLPVPPQPRNQIVVYQPDSEVPQAQIRDFFFRQKAPTHQVKSSLAKNTKPGWMGLKFGVDKFYPHAETNVSYTEADPEKDPDSAPAALEVEVAGHKKWLELESPAEIKGEKSSYYVRLSRKQYPLGIPNCLKRSLRWECMAEVTSP